jgi:hypothetical protein
MEYGLRLSTVSPSSLLSTEFETLKDSSLPHGSLTSLYFGSEFCEYLLPSLDEAEAFCALARKAGLEPVLLTPLVTDSGLNCLGKLLQDLALVGYSPTVTFNDWGVLRVLRTSFPNNKCNAGRLINRSLRDSRLAANQQPIQSEIGGGRLRALLTGIGVTAVETDADLEGNYLERDSSSLKRVLHLPYTFTVSGRNCLVRADISAAENSFTKGLGKGCPAPCRGKILPVDRPDTDQTLWRSGNTIFYKAPVAAVENYLSRCDRIVLHERPLP